MFLSILDRVKTSSVLEATVIRNFLFLKIFVSHKVTKIFLLYTANLWLTFDMNKIIAT